MAGFCPVTLRKVAGECLPNDALKCIKRHKVIRIISSICGNAINILSKSTLFYVVIYVDRKMRFLYRSLAPHYFFLRVIEVFSFTLMEIYCILPMYDFPYISASRQYTILCSMEVFLD